MRGVPAGGGSVFVSDFAGEGVSVKEKYELILIWGKSDPGMYFSTGRKVPKAHRGGQFVHEGVAAPDPRILRN